MVSIFLAGMYGIRAKTVHFAHKVCPDDVWLEVRSRGRSSAVLQAGTFENESGKQNAWLLPQKVKLRVTNAVHLQPLECHLQFQ